MGTVIVWCPVLIMCAILLASNAKAYLMNLCDDSISEYHLSSSGSESALTVSLGTVDGDNNELQQRGPCKLKVTAPDDHIIALSFISSSETDEELEKLQNNNQSCVLTTYTIEKKTPTLKIDPCIESLPPAKILTAPLRIVWNPPESSKLQVGLSGVTLLVTAIGKGGVCIQSSKFGCLQPRWPPLTCVADELVCDGIPHCPRDASDEDPEMCAERVLDRSSLEYLTRELMKRLTDQQAGKLENNIYIKRRQYGRGGVTSSTNSDNTDNRRPVEGTSTGSSDRRKRPLDSISAALDHYGPWGYLMFAMLICGTMLMFCGLWECFCRRRKTEDTSPTPNVLAATTQLSRTATVMIVSASSEDLTPPAPGPPAYDELDQPPSYSMLFPVNKLDPLILNPKFFQQTTGTGSVVNGGVQLTSENNNNCSGGVYNRTLILQDDINSPSGTSVIEVCATIPENSLTSNAQTSELR